MQLYSHRSAQAESGNTSSSATFRKSRGTLTEILITGDNIDFDYIYIENILSKILHNEVILNEIISRMMEPCHRVSRKILHAENKLAIFLICFSYHL